MRYNGWANYATWRVNLEIFDGLTPNDFIIEKDYEFSELVDALKEYAFNLIESESKGFAFDYAMAFLSEVDYCEIARHMAEIEIEAI